MTTRRFRIGIGFGLALLLAILLVVWKGHSSAQPLSVVFVGYTNGLAACVISNQCSHTLKIWAVAYAEAAPFNATNGPNQWTIVGGPRDRYLKPGDAQYLTFHRPAITGQWRLMIPWSEGYRARIRDRIHQYKFIPLRFRVAPEYYASSAVITE
jgi:hypothetical protein